MTEKSSALQDAIKARGRQFATFPISGFFKLGGAAVLRVGIRLAVKSEDDRAVVAACNYAAAIAGKGEGAEAARKDGDLLGDAKTLEALSNICREVDPADPEKITGFAAFPGGSVWMRENITTDQLAVLLNLYIEAKGKLGPAPAIIDDDHVEALAEALSITMATDWPEAKLAPYSRPSLTHLCVMLAVKLVESRKAVEVLLKEREETVSGDPEPTVEPASE